MCRELNLSVIGRDHPCQDVSTPDFILACLAAGVGRTGAYEQNEVFDWQGDVSRLSLTENLGGPDLSALHLVTLDCQYAISRITIGPVP